MSKSMNIVLTGFMGTGKSKTGKLLSQRLKMRHIDIDELIEKGEKRKIHQIFQEEGEAYFRRVEKEAVAQIARVDGCVISTGGGVVLDKENMDFLRQKGLIICLHSNPETILSRTAKGENRPLLQGVSNPAERIRKLLNIRMPHYQQADLMIDTSGRSPEEVVETIVENLGKKWKKL